MNSSKIAEARSVADVHYFNSPQVFQDSVDHAIAVRLIAVEKAPVHNIPLNEPAAIRISFETENGLAET